MSIDLEKVSKLTGFVDKLIQIKDMETILDESVVGEMIDQAITISGASYTNEEKEAAKRDITWKYQIFATPGQSILEDYEQDNWYDDRKAEIDKFNYLLNYLKEKMKILSEESGAKIEVNLESKLPSVVNDYNLVQIGRKIGEDIFKERFVLGEKVYLAGDNAAYYFQKTPGIRMVFFAKRENEINYPLHNSKFDFNEDIFYYELSTIYQMILNI